MDNIEQCAGWGWVDLAVLDFRAGALYFCALVGLLNALVVRQKPSKSLLCFSAAQVFKERRPARRTERNRSISGIEVIALVSCGFHGVTRLAGFTLQACALRPGAVSSA